MQQIQALDQELTLEKEKSIKYRGTARIKLEWLHFAEKQLDIKHVQDLQSRFQRDCRRLDTRNHVPAIIDEQDLDCALRVSGISLPINAQHEFPELGFRPGYKLECLHGRHRIQAAKQALLPPDKWWTVDLYLADISSELKTALTEEYANERQPSDGEAYRKIREYHFLKQCSLETRWWTRLSSHRAKNLKQLLRHKDITAAFDSLLEIPALLEGMRISTLHKMFATRCDEEILRYLRHIKEFWSYLLQQDKTAMERVDQVTVEALQLTAPWASTVDADILRGKVLGGKVFCTFNQREREEIWTRLQSFKGLVPSLYGFFEDIKLLKAWANCLTRLIRLGSGDTVSTALKKIYTGTNQNTGSALVQGTEANLDLGCRQLQAFAMRNYRVMPKKFSGKPLLARPMATVDTTKLREMADLANSLGFESSNIRALKQYPNSADPTAVRENNRPILVTAGPGDSRKQRCGMPHDQSYEDDCKFLFLTHLHDDRNEQSKRITSFFRLRSVYLNFYGMPSHALRAIDCSTSQQYLTSVTEEAVSHVSSSAYSSTQSQIREPEHMNVDVKEGECKQTENTVMHEKRGEEQRFSLQVQDVLAQKFIIQEQQRQKLLSNASTLKQQTQEQKDYRQNLLRNASALREQEQKQEQQRQKLLVHKSTLEKQEQEQEQYQQKLARNANAFIEQEQEQEQQRQKLLSDVSTLEKKEQECRQNLAWYAGTLRKQEQEQEQQSQKLLSKVSTLEKQEQEQEQYRQKLAETASALREQEQEQECRRQKLIFDASTLKEQEQQQEQMCQKLTMKVNVLREQEQGREKQRQNLATEESKLINWKQKQEEQRQTLATHASELNRQEQKQEERRQALATIADELVNQEQRQEEQRKNLAKYASDLKNQTLWQNKQRQTLTKDISEPNKQKKCQKINRKILKQKRELKSVKQKVLRGKQDKSGAIQEREEPDIDEIQRQNQDELADLKSSPSLELEHEGVYVYPITYEIRAKNCSIDSIQKDSTQVGVSVPKGGNSPAQDHEPRQDEAQEQVQENRQNEKAKENRLYKAEAQANEANELRAEERGQEHRVQENGQADEAHEGETREGGANEGGAHEAEARNDTDGAQEAGQENKAHKNRPDDEAYEYRVVKRRVVTEESEDDEALRAQQLLEGRNPKGGKYQRLNRFRSLSQVMKWEGDTSINDTEEEDITPMPRKKPQTLRRQRAKNTTAAAATGNTNGSTKLTSDFTFEAQQASSRGT